MDQAEYDEVLAQAIESGRLNESAAADPDLTQSFSACRKIDSLFDLLRLPPELAAVANAVPGLPRSLGRYQIVRLLGEGRYGRVFLAYDDRLMRPVAIKVPKHGGSHLLGDARKAASLHHPGVVAIHAVEEEADGSFFVVMEYVEGRTLAERIKKGKLPPSEAATLMIHVADALQQAHVRGLLHRDLKPANILLDSEGRPRVADFGMAVHESQQVDLAGQVSGTPCYMAPEQVRGEAHRMDGRADLWSLGVILYEALTGRLPFSGRTVDDVFDEIKHREPKPPRQIDPDIPVELERICLKCLAKPIGARYAAAIDLARDLRRWQRPRRRWWAGVGGGAALALALGASLWLLGPAQDTAGPPPPVHLELSLLDQEGTAVGRETVMATDQRFAVMVKTDRPILLALLQFTSEGEVFEMPLSQDAAQQTTTLAIDAHIQYRFPLLSSGYKLTPPPGGELIIAIAADDSDEMQESVGRVKQALSSLRTGPIGIPRGVLGDATRGKVELPRVDDHALAAVQRVRQVCLDLWGEDRILVIWNLPPQTSEEPSLFLPER